MIVNYLAKNDTIILQSHPIYPESKKYSMFYSLFGELIFDENGEVTKIVFSGQGDRMEAKKID